MWHLRASIAALLIGIAIGLVSTHGCAGEHPLDDPPLDHVDDFDDAPSNHDALEAVVPSRDHRDASRRNDGASAVGDTSESVDSYSGTNSGAVVVAGDPGYYSEDANEFFGASRCPAFVSMCEDFENGMPSTAVWSLAMTSNTVIGVDSMQHARGTGALHITLPPEPSEAYLRHVAFFPRADDIVWGRLFFYIAQPGPDAFVHYNLVEATGASQQDEGIQKLVRYGGVAVRDLANAFEFDNWLFNFEQRPQPDGFDELAVREDGRLLDRGAWRCMEFMFDGVASEARVFRDGVEIVNARGESPLEGEEWSMPSFDGINIGFAHYQFIDHGFDVWIDGVALDDERIGCSN